MVALIQGSNRKGNTTQHVIDVAAKHLAKTGREFEVINLELLPSEVLHSGMYAGRADNAFLNKAESVLREADNWIFAFPEYNGSFPGGLKLFIDAMSVRDYKTLFGAKRSALIGTASGRAGNLRGLDHFTAVLHHLGTIVMPQTLPISLIDSLLVEGEGLVDKVAQQTISNYVDRFLTFGAQVPAVEV